jgi:hypothetical protein
MNKPLVVLMILASLGASALACSQKVSCFDEHSEIPGLPERLSVQSLDDGGAPAGDAGAGNDAELETVQEACKKLQCAPGLDCVVHSNVPGNVRVECGRGPC